MQISLSFEVVLWQAAELLRHAHLQPYVLKVHLKLNSPRRNSLSHWPESNYARRTRFSEPDNVPISSYREKQYSFSNNRNLNPSISGTEQDSLCSTKGIHNTPAYLNRRLSEVSVESSHEGTVICKPIASKTSFVAKTPRLASTKASTNRKGSYAVKKHESVRSYDFLAPSLFMKSRIIPSSKCNLSLFHELGSYMLFSLFLQHPVSHLPSKKSIPSSRRASLPLPPVAAIRESPYRPNSGILHCVKSPDVSVNEPRIDRIAEFPLASYEDTFFPIPKTSPTSAQGSSSSPLCVDRSITKDKCTVQKCDRASANHKFTEAWQGIQHSMFQVNEEEGSNSSDQNATAGASSRNSSDARRHRFDTSSYQQRAEALEGLLEFSAKLLQQERYDELGVLLKPFGPGKVSPRETAIWLTKSIKENTAKQDDQHP